MYKITNNIYYLLFILFFISGCTPNKEIFYAPVEQRGELFYGKMGISKLMTVKAEENIIDIASNYQVSYEDLIKINSLQSPYKLSVGMVLKLPTERFHKAKQGERLQDIARKYNTDIKYMSYINNISDISSIKSGQMIKIPHKQSIFCVTQTQEITSIPTIRNNKQVAQPNIRKTPNLSSQKNKPVINKPVIINNFKIAYPLNSSQFMWPLNGKVASHFGKYGNDFNEGVNILAPIGSVVVAASPGKVIYTGHDLKEYGKLIIIQHNHNIMSAYAHINSILVKNGQQIKKGQIIAKVGKTGYVDTPQLFFSLRKNNNTIDPEKAM